MEDLDFLSILEDRVTEMILKKAQRYVENLPVAKERNFIFGFGISDSLNYQTYLNETQGLARIDILNAFKILFDKDFNELEEGQLEFCQTFCALVLTHAIKQRKSVAFPFYLPKPEEFKKLIPTVKIYGYRSFGFLVPFKKQSDSSKWGEVSSEQLDQLHLDIFWKVFKAMTNHTYEDMIEFCYETGGYSLTNDGELWGYILKEELDLEHDIYLFYQEYYKQSKEEI